MSENTDTIKTAGAPRVEGGGVASENADANGNQGDKLQQALLDGENSKKDGTANGQPTEGVRGKLSKLLGIKQKAVCTCGRKSGVQGRHAKDCPVSGASEPKHFGSVDLSRQNAPLPLAVNPAGEIPVAPPDFTWWGRVTKTVLRTRERFKVRKIRKKTERVLPADEAEETSRDFLIPQKEVSDLADAVTKCAEHYNISPKHAPLADVAMCYFNIEAHWWAAEARLDARLKKIEEALKQQKANEPRN
jgi:hypothetical protein